MGVNGNPVVRFTILIATLMPCATIADVSDLVEAIANTEFNFQNDETILPSLAAGYLRYTNYGESQIESSIKELDALKFEQHGFTNGLVFPVIVKPRDMLLLGYSVSANKFDFDSSDSIDGELYEAGFVAGYLHQLNVSWTLAAFAAPFIHSSLNGGDPWEDELYTGIMARYINAPTTQWIMGGVFHQGLETDTFYPYLGVIWSPHPNWTFDITLPWPSINYAINSDWFFRVGVNPSGAEWIARNEQQLALGFGGWDLGVFTEFRLYNYLWLSGGIGYSGLRSLGITSDGDIPEGNRLQSEPFLRVGLNLRF